MKLKTVLAGALVAGTVAGCGGNDSVDKVGSVDTAFNFIGPNHKVVVETFPDPDINGVTVFVSRAKTGGMFGWASEDPSDASIATRQTGPIKFKKPISKTGEEILNEKTSLIFKQFHVTRMFNEASNSIVYLVWSDKLIDGSPKNSISAVTLQPWGNIPADQALLKP
jgi:CreA protein